MAKTKVGQAEITQHQIESQQSWIGLGSDSLYSEFFNIDFKDRSFSYFKDSLFTLSIGMSSDIVVHHREIYNSLDLLGDIGGLMDALIIIGSLIIVCFTTIIGNQLDVFLVEKLFQRPGKRSKKD